MNYIFSNLSKTELIVIVILALLLFGGKKIPELMKGLGTGLKEFNKALKNNKNNDNKNNDNNDLNKKKSNYFNENEYEQYYKEDDKL